MPPSFAAASAAELDAIDRYWRACLYLCAGMLYLQDNPLLELPLEPSHIKRRLLGHWGSDPGLALVLAHLNRAIVQRDLQVAFVCGPGHGAPAVLAHAWMEGTYGELHADKGHSPQGLRNFFKHFSFPGGLGSHCTPQTPGSVHEGGELGYSLAHAFGMAFDHPDLVVVCMVGDGEAETGPLATAWHSLQFLNPARDGAVLPVLHLNGYKIANPTLLARLPRRQLAELLRGYGYAPWFVEGDDPAAVHRELAGALDQALERMATIQRRARSAPATGVERWPVIVLRTPKGWTGPKVVDGHQVEGTWRAHQIPLDPNRDAQHLRLLEQWLRSYHPERCFDSQARPLPELLALAPRGSRRISAQPVANGGLLRRPLRLPEAREHAVAVDAPGALAVDNTRPLGRLLRDVIRANPDNFRIFSPDELASNRLDDVYQATAKAWMGRLLPEDADGGHLAADGRVMEYLSEHTLEGWLEGYLLSGRHGIFASYEAFTQIVGSMFNQHAKWLEKAAEVPWRASVSSLNLVLSSTVWRQDHNGFSHQDPGFLDLVTHKSPRITRIYLPPDANCLLAVARHCLDSVDKVNVIVADKQQHLQYLGIDQAIAHCARGIGIWDWASNAGSEEPDLVMACAGDVPTLEALAATALLREHLPEVKVRLLNVVDLFRLLPDSEHEHGLPDAEFDALFTRDKPVVFNFHGYPSLVRKLCFRRANARNLHVHGYNEHGSVDTPLALAMRNRIDRFHLVLDALERLPRLGSRGDPLRRVMHEEILACGRHARQHGEDPPQWARWTWPQRPPRLTR